MRKPYECSDTYGLPLKNKDVEEYLQRRGRRHYPGVRNSSSFLSQFENKSVTDYNRTSGITAGTDARMKDSNEYLKQKMIEDAHAKFQLENDINTYIHKISQQDKSEMIDQNAENYLKFFMNNKSKIKYSPYPNKMRRNNSMLLTSPQREEDPEKIESINPLLKYKRNKLNDVTNPDLYYKILNGEYLKYREQQKKVLDYNFDIMQSRIKRKQEVDVNPFNPNLDSFVLGNSTLNHNTILNPLPNYTYNKYIDQQINNGN